MIIYVWENIKKAKGEKENESTMGILILKTTVSLSSIFLKWNKIRINSLNGIYG